VQTGDTIAAISSAVGSAPRMIVRLSGPQAVRIASSLCNIPDAAPQGADRITLKLRGIYLPSWIYRFESPRSATGEDIVELHVPGNALLAGLVLNEMIRCGARLAEPGEFTARAYFNGKLDLTEAEGVAATISAHNDRQLSASRQLLAGELARRLQPVLDMLAETLALIEAGIDFSEEDVSFISHEALRSQINRADAVLDELLTTSHRFELLPSDPKVVLVGRPNAGKSTLLNALAGTERAVVSPVAGTTRDALSATVALARGFVTMYDVAGIDTTSDETGVIEQAMRDTAIRTLKTADFVVLVLDSTDARSPLNLGRDPDMVVHTKTGGADSYEPPMARIRQELSDRLFGSWTGSEKLTLNARHVAAITEARSALTQAVHSVTGGHELVAMELREALDQLGGLIGHVTPDDIVGRIFAQFCIGK
jgi:tRNA modification GTPase